MGGEEVGPYLGNEGQRAFELLGHDNALNGEDKLGLIGDACVRHGSQWASTDPGVSVLAGWEAGVTETMGTAAAQPNVPSESQHM